MLNLFTKSKIDVTKLHQQYRNKQIAQSEYSEQIRIALCECLISDEARKKMEKLGIDIMNPQDSLLSRCKKKELVEIANEVWRSTRAISTLSKALDKIEPNESYKWPSERYKGKTMISHREWHTFYENFDNKILEESTSFSPEEIYKHFIKMNLGTFKLVSHSIVMKYMRLTFWGATIA